MHTHFNAQQAISLFVLLSYCVGWVLIALKAKDSGFVDLCDLVRRFLLAPFVTAGIIVFGMLFSALLVLAAPHALIICKIFVMAVGVFAIFLVFLKYAIVPGVKKSYGVIEPYSSKLCVVLYRKKY